MNEIEKMQSFDYIKSDWVSVDEDYPIIQKGYENVSVDVNIIMTNGTIYENAFFSYHGKCWYNSHCDRIKETKSNRVEGWQTP